MNYRDDHHLPGHDRDRVKDHIRAMMSRAAESEKKKKIAAGPKWRLRIIEKES